MLQTGSQLKILIMLPLRLANMDIGRKFIHISLLEKRELRLLILDWELPISKKLFND